MRLRKKPGALEELVRHNDIVIFNPKIYKGKWAEFFKNDNPIYVELGMGKGRFITENADKYPENNYIGVEVKNEVILKALYKVLDMNLKNIALLPFNITYIDEVFEENEVDGIYLNFSDPWPKVRHAKRRLTNRNFLDKYRKFLKKGGQIVFKTDNKDLFDYSVEEFNSSGFELVEVTYDLASLNDCENIMTEYEEKFVNMGMKIYRLKALNL